MVHINLWGSAVSCKENFRLYVCKSGENLIKLKIENVNGTTVNDAPETFATKMFSNKKLVDFNKTFVSLKILRKLYKNFDVLGVNYSLVHSYSLPGSPWYTYIKFWTTSP